MYVCVRGVMDVGVMDVAFRRCCMFVDVRKWITHKNDDVMDIVLLYKDDSDVHMFTVKVHYKY